MKRRNKGKVHPFSSSSSSSSLPPQNDAGFPVLNLLPAAIFALISVLSIEDREVLAYMVSRSLKSDTNPPLIFPCEDKIKNFKSKQPKDCHNKSPALFDCECFHCYTSFWCRWDSSPNRELIHVAIEAFEEHLNNGEQSRKGGNELIKKRAKISRRKIDGGVESPAVGSPEDKDCLDVSVTLKEEIDDVEKVVEVSVAEEGLAAVAVQGHRGLVRKVLPDVMGIFNSRLWRLWSPNV